MNAHARRAGTHLRQHGHLDDDGQHPDAENTGRREMTCGSEGATAEHSGHHPADRVEIRPAHGVDPRTHAKQPALPDAVMYGGTVEPELA
jgi:hypothetical protein